MAAPLGFGQVRKFGANVVSGEVFGQVHERGEFGTRSQHGEGTVAEIAAKIEQASGDGGNQAGAILAGDGDEPCARH